MHHTIIVLSDGETWSVLKGCSICVVTDAEFNELNEGTMGANHIEPLAEIPL